MSSLPVRHLCLRADKADVLSPPKEAGPPFRGDRPGSLASLPTCLRGQSPEGCLVCLLSARSICLSGK